MNQNSAELAASLEEIGWMNGSETSIGAVGWSLPQAFWNYMIMIGKVKTKPEGSRKVGFAVNSFISVELSESSIFCVRYFLSLFQLSHGRYFLVDFTALCRGKHSLF
jgi:hypothetical protein